MTSVAVWELSESHPGIGGGLIPRESGVMPAPRKYPPELRERSQRLVSEAMAEDSSLSIEPGGAADRPDGRGGSGHAAGLGEAGRHRYGAAAGHEHGGDGAGQGTGTGGPRDEAG